MATDEALQSFFTDYNLAKLEVENTICDKHDVDLKIIDLDETIHNYDDFWNTFVPGDVLVTNNRQAFLKLEGPGSRWVDSQGVQIKDEDLFFELVLASYRGHKIKLAHIAAQSF